MAVDVEQAAWEARWKAVRPQASYQPTWGLEQAWKANADTWGYPLEDGQVTVTVSGEDFQARTFSLIGIVIWHPAQGALVIGWP